MIYNFLILLGVSAKLGTSYVFIKLGERSIAPITEMAVNVAFLNKPTSIRGSRARNSIKQKIVSITKAVTNRDTIVAELQPLPLSLTNLMHKTLIFYYNSEILDIVYEVITSRTCKDFRQHKNL